MRLVISGEQFQKLLEEGFNIDISKCLLNGASVVETAAKDACPVGTGELRNSINTRLDGPYKAVVGSNLEYAPYVEYGTGIFAYNGDGRQEVPWRYQDEEGNWHTTSGISPTLFLTNALQDNKKEVLQMIEQTIQKEIEDDITNL